MSKFYKSLNGSSPSVYYSSIPNTTYVFRVKKRNKIDGSDMNTTEHIKLEFLMEPDNLTCDSKYSQ
jgi:hypothetical protein